MVKKELKAKIVKKGTTEDDESFPGKKVDETGGESERSKLSEAVKIKSEYVPL